MMEILVKFLGIVALIVGLALLLALPTMWMWNWLMPMIFGLMKLSFWQALGINFLAEILFKKNK